MNKRCVALAVASCLTAATASWAFDSVRTTKGTVTGTIKSVSPVKVVVEKSAASGLSEEVPANEVVMVFFDEDPTPLKTARQHLLAGRLEDAAAALEKVDPAQVKRPEMQQDVEYLKAYCATKLALAGNGDLAAARAAMLAFLTNHKTSFHVVEAYEMLGHLSVALADYGKAEEYYTTMAKAPWPDTQMRAKVARGRAALAQKKYAEANQAFDEVLATQAEGELAESQRMAATLGKARVMAAENKAAEAINAVTDIIARANPEQSELLAQAYNTLGVAHRLAGNPGAALMAFLHTDVLYHSAADAHAEALANLVELWEQKKMPERAAEARAILDQRYKNSPWNKKGG